MIVFQNNYEKAVKDHSKGRSVFQVVQSQAYSTDLPTEDGQRKMWISLLKVFEKVWEEVNCIVKEFKAKLFILLDDMSMTIEIHEKYIQYLTDFDHTDDVVWRYIGKRYDWILASINKAYGGYEVLMYGNSLIQI